MFSAARTLLTRLPLRMKQTKSREDEIKFVNKALNSSTYLSDEVSL